MNLAPLLFALIATSAAPESREPILLDFQASWCGPCQQMRPAIQQLIDKGYPVREIDFDTRRELAERYNVKNVPTYIVVDPSGRELARTEGVQRATQLAALYRQAKARVVSGQSTVARGTPDPEPAEGEPSAEDDPPAGEPEQETRPARTNPDPWETVVRIKVRGQGSIGFGSGTIIHSTAEESIILTCAHIFKLDNRQQTAPSRFPLPIDVDLFDGQLHSMDHPQVHYVKTVQGEAIDYDFGRDVGLIRIRPGDKLPASRVVPPSWVARPGMKMTTVGCSEGNDATAWSTRITKSGIRLFNNSAYEATECVHAPKQGRSGGGLYDEKGYVAGVCDFAEPRGNHGFYATPRSIYHILDRNNLMALYAPAGRPGSGALLAAGRPDQRRSRPSSIARAQSPEGEEPGRITMPSPNMLGIQTPSVAQDARRKPSGRPSWQPVPEGGEARAERAELKMAPEADNDRFIAPADEPARPERVAVQPPASRSKPRSKSNSWRAVREPADAR